MEQRERFVLKALAPDVNMSALCREFGISRRVGYKWVQRFKERGVRGLEEMARRPNRSPLQCSADAVAEIVSLRRAHPSWGPKKLRVILEREGLVDVPSVSTIGRVLKRAGLSSGRRRTKPRKSSPTKRVEVAVHACHDLWTVDFKGWWRTKDRQKVEPLTVRDAHSRFVLAIELVTAPSVEQVKPVFEKLFAEQGMPKAIRSDNGPPFAATQGVVGLSKLSAWWVALGIRHVRGRPSCPQDNGGHERMHRDMKAELQANPAWDRLQQQRHCDRWRHDFNQHRPHEALGMETPASVYRRSSRAYPGGVPELVYPEHFQTRKISASGGMRFGGRQRALSNALHGYTVGIEVIDGGKRFHVWFADLCVGVGRIPWDAPLRPPGPPEVPRDAAPASSGPCRSAPAPTT